jgi:hypothetical protein
MPPRRTNDPKHWRDREAQMRALALTMTDSETTILMNDLAADYDKLADRAAIKANGKKPPTNPSRARRAATYHDPRSDELTLSSIFRNKVAVPIPLFNYRESS